MSQYDGNAASAQIKVSVQAKDKEIGHVLVPLNPQYDGRVRELWLTMRDGADQDTATRVHIRLYQRCSVEPREIDTLGMSVYCYQEKLASMKTGDLVMFAGGSRVSQVIKQSVDSPISHVGIVVRMPDPKHDNRETLFVVESDQVEEGDYFSDSPCNGICYSQLAQRMHSYQGNLILLASLQSPLSRAQEDQIIALAEKFRDEGIPFDIEQLLGVGVGNALGTQNTEDFSKLFCSEFVTACLKEVELVPNALNASMQAPFVVANFSCYHPDNQLLRFQLTTTKRVPLI